MFIDIGVLGIVSQNVMTDTTLMFHQSYKQIIYKLNYKTSLTLKHNQNFEIILSLKKIVYDTNLIKENYCNIRDSTQ